MRAECPSTPEHADKTEVLSAEDHFGEVQPSEEGHRDTYFKLGDAIILEDESENLATERNSVVY